MEFESIQGVLALLAVVLLFGAPVIIVIAILVHRARRTQVIHDTVVRLAEKGLPVPPELFVDRRPEDPRSSLHKGIILVMVGIGLTVFFLTMPDRRAPWGVGVIPLLIGIGYLIVWKLEQKREGNG